MLLVEPYLVSPAAPLTRASTATYLDAAGVLRYAAVNVARPIIEVKAATNLIASSAVFSASGNGDNLVSAGTLAPDGLAMADFMAVGSLSGEHDIVSAASTALVAGATYAASVFVKSRDPRLTRCVVRVGGRQALVRLMTTGGLAVGLVSASSGASASVTACAIGWVLVTLQFVAASASARSIAVLADRGVGNAAEDSDFGGSSGEIAAWGAQIELGEASSCIPTSGAVATRAADIPPAVVAGFSDLLSSNVPVTDYPVWLVGTAYIIGNKVTVTNSTDVFEAIAASTGVSPVLDATGKWQNIGKVNRWKMFDGYMSTGTEYASEISCSVRPASPVDSLVLFGLSGASVRVTVTDTYEGEVYSKTIVTRSHLAQATWHGYFKSPQIDVDLVILTDVPLSRNCIVSIQISAPSGIAACGMCLLGRKDEIGQAQWGLGFGIQDYSAKTPNDFGDFDIVERAYSDDVNYQVFVDTADNNRIKKRLASVRAKACVYIGHPDYPESVVYGYFTSFDQVLKFVTYSDYNLEVRGKT